MLSIIRRLLRLADNFAAKIRIAFVFGFLEGVFTNFPILAILYILSQAIINGLKSSDIIISAALIVVGLIGQYAFRRLVYHFQNGTGYEIFERERIEIGNRFKRFPMGFFSAGNLGNLTAVVTSDISFVEMWAMDSVYKEVNGYVGMLISCIFLFVLDYRIALISLGIYVIALFILKRIQEVGKEQSFVKQKIQAELSGAVLEYVQSIAVIKAFNMIAEKTKATKETFQGIRDHSIEFEEKFIPPNFLYDLSFQLGIALTIFFTASFTLKGSLDLAVMLMLMVFIFQLYLPTKALGILTLKMRVMEASLDRYEAAKKVEIIDEDGIEIKLERFDIEFQNVTFAYEHKDVLHKISFTVPERSMTALVGASGSGKTTIVNLIARFWDVQQGAIKVGGVNVKEMSCDSLLANMSMVFQNVYLFNDTILNNIKFGKPGATDQEIVAAAQKARCHDFIMELENGYNTVVGEGGATLSGGEKQRISIARAILKDAPIILLDEATASVDPYNEKYIQLAITELIQDKTLVVIAHRLSTIKNAEQILVIDQGKVMQKGTHDKLIEEEGQYYDFWQRRVKARSWKITQVSG